MMSTDSQSQRIVTVTFQKVRNIRITEGEKDWGEITSPSRVELSWNKRMDYACSDGNIYQFGYQVTQAEVKRNEDPSPLVRAQRQGLPINGLWHVDSPLGPLVLQRQGRPLKYPMAESQWILQDMQGAELMDVTLPNTAESAVSFLKTLSSGAAPPAVTILLKCRQDCPVYLAVFAWWLSENAANRVGLI